MDFSRSSLSLHLECGPSEGHYSFCPYLPPFFVSIHSSSSSSSSPLTLFFLQSLSSRHTALLTSTLPSPPLPCPRGFPPPRVYLGGPGPNQYIDNGHRCYSSRWVPNPHLAVYSKLIFNVGHAGLPEPRITYVTGEVRGPDVKFIPHFS